MKVIPVWRPWKTIGVCLAVSLAAVGCSTPSPEAADSVPPPEVVWELAGVGNAPPEAHIIGDLVVLDELHEDGRELVAYQLEDGAERWRLADVAGKVWLTTDRVVLRDPDGAIAVHELATGDLKLSLKHTGADRSDFITTPLTAVTEEVVVSVDAPYRESKVISGFDLHTGVELWTWEVGDGSDYPADQIGIEAAHVVTPIDLGRIQLVFGVFVAADNPYVLVTINEIFGTFDNPSTMAFLVDAATSDQVHSFHTQREPTWIGAPVANPEGYMATGPERHPQECDWSGLTITDQDKPVKYQAESAAPDLCRAPLRTDDAVFGIVDGHPVLQALTTDGPDWTTDAIGEPVLYADGIAWYRDTDGVVHAVDIAKDTELWSVAGDVIGGSNAMCGSVLVTGNNYRWPASVIGLDARTGKTRWVRSGTEEVAGCTDEVALVTDQTSRDGYSMAAIRVSG